MNRCFLVLLIAVALLPAQAGAGDKPRIPVLLDTDIGSYVDDAFAMALLLSSADVEMLGITTCAENAEDRAWIVGAILTRCGFPPPPKEVTGKTPPAGPEKRGIPVAFGREPQPKNALDWQIQYRRHPAVIFNRTQRPAKESAVDLMARALKERPGKVTIIAVGPLTNVARLLKEHPTVKDSIKGLVVMGGSFGKEAKGEPEWNIKSDVAAARAVLASGLPITLVPLETAEVVLPGKERDRLFARNTPLTMQVQALYQLWDAEDAMLFDAVAAATALRPDLFRFADARVEVDERGGTTLAVGKANARVAVDLDRKSYIEWFVETLSTGKQALPRGDRNPSRLVDRGRFPAKVHVCEDYDTDIEKRWWMSGKAETKDVPPGGVRAQRSVLTQDFDDRQGDLATMYSAVIFNPVPGPPMGRNTRLSFRYKLIGTDRMRVQLYSLTNGYHRYLSLEGLPRNEWKEGAVDMTQMRRPDGTGGPLSENERIDDIQFYVDPRAQVLIDDVVLYDAAVEAEKRPFPKRVIYTAWFDTGKHGKEWLGEFEIVNHDKPRSWKAARSVPDKASGQAYLRLSLKGERAAGAGARLSFRYLIKGGDRVEISLTRKSRAVASTTLMGMKAGAFGEADVSLGGAAAMLADELHFLLPRGAELIIDDVVLYEPGE